MILIADGGSTKADWILLDKYGVQVFKSRTEGLNPEILSEHILTSRIQENKDLLDCKNKVEEVYFYGAGCGTDRLSSLLKAVFESFFVNAKVVVREDTYAAVYAVTSKPGIVCILGTGSNSSYFNGDKVETRIPSLGYILMDEASGNYFGKKLILDYFYNRMPKNLADKFDTQFNLDADVVKKNIYKKENPNAYLAKFVEFILRNERNDYFNEVLRKGMIEFFENRILTYPEAKKLPVHFVGSIAYFAQDAINYVANLYDIEIGNIIRRPIDGLLEYHREQLKLEQI
jgi:N-acetylglucosamine kinase-like BadF-type ATPase